MNLKPQLGLTMGDPAGVGPEICLRVMNDPTVARRCVPVLFGDAGVLRRVSALGLPALPKQVLSLAQWKQQTGPVTEPVLVDCAAVKADSVQPGKVSAECGHAAYVFIEQAIAAAKNGRLEGVVTAPINKESLRLSGVPHPGHTEIFTALTGAKRSCMMLRSSELTVSMVTTHIGYWEVPQKLTIERVLDVIELTAEAMQWVLGRPARLCLCGLNPHAGEHGLFGHGEEEKILMPAIEKSRAKGLTITGPLPPDTVFAPAVRKQFDAIVTLYHDQGHIPFKMVAFETGVNISLGLPVIRTSVDHGTAFDIAWKGKASPQSLLCAIDIAVDMALGRRKGAA
jgi:4-phospho-D-threonate 3-dehydrogenase / 4-phospho-D-erythronate 3-dehydrogenase